MAIKFRFGSASNNEAEESGTAALDPARLNRKVESIVFVATMVVVAVSIFPALGSARQDRKRSICASNMQQLGSALAQYVRDYDGVLPVAYHYANTDPDQKDGLDDTGIHHWSGRLMPYLTNTDIFVCPNDAAGGQPPTNFNLSTNNAGAGLPPGANSGVGDLQDDQAPRISYTVNEQLMPRPRGGVGGVNMGQPQNLVRVASVDKPADTISMAEFTDHLNAVSGGGPGGIKFKSHRPACALVMDKSGSTPYDTSKPVSGTLYAVPPDAAAAIMDMQERVKFGSKKEPHIIYVNSGRHSRANNWLFLDGHVALKTLRDTLNCDSFNWGIKAYNQGNAPVMCGATGKPVQ